MAELIYPEGFEEAVCNANIKELNNMKKRIDREIMLHETAVKEGYL